MIALRRQSPMWRVITEKPSSLVDIAWAYASFGPLFRIVFRSVAAAAFSPRLQPGVGGENTIHQPFHGLTFIFKPLPPAKAWGDLLPPLRGEIRMKSWSSFLLTLPAKRGQTFDLSAHSPGDLCVVRCECIPNVGGATFSSRQARDSDCQQQSQKERRDCGRRRSSGCRESSLHGNKRLPTSPSRGLQYEITGIPFR